MTPEQIAVMRDELLPLPEDRPIVLTRQTTLALLSAAEENARLREALYIAERAMVALIKTGRERIIELGGACDSIEQMERDPALVAIRAALKELAK